MGLQANTWYSDIVRGLFAYLDKMVYGLVKWVLFGVFDLSTITTNSDIFSGIYERIYVILGIFMAFKLSFSFFQYIINPDKMNSKNDTGVAKIFGRVALMLGCLMILPTLLFGNGSEKGILSRAQDAFLPVLPKFIFGAENNLGINFSGDVTKTVEDTSEEIAVTTLSGFFSPSEELDEACGEGTFDKTPPIKSLNEFGDNVNLKCNAKGTGFLGIGATQYYKYSYMWGISTIVGVLELALFLGITIDIAKRLFKMIILEIIAPVPIMSLIDPKGAKDGAFSHWVKSLTTTFLDIFLKLGLVYIIIVLIHLIVNANDKGGIFANFPERQGFRGTYLTIFLILGLIFFAKEAPKFIKDALGLKDGGGSLFDDVKSIGKAAGLVGGAAVGLGAATAGNFVNAADAVREGKPGKAVSNLITSPGAALAGAIRGGSAGFKGAGKNGNPLAGITSAVSAQSAVNANKRAYYESGSTVGGRAKARLGSMIGRTPADVDDARITGYKAVEDSAKDIDDALTKGIVNKNFNARHTYSGTKAGAPAFKYSDYKAAMASHNDAWANTYYNGGIVEAMADEQNVTKAAKKDFYADYVSGAGTPAEQGDYTDLRNAESVMSTASQSAKLGTVHSFDEYDTAKKAAKQRRIDIVGSTKYAARKADAKAVGKGKK